MVEKMEDYKYSGYKEYLNNRSLADTAFSLAMVGRENGYVFEEENFEVAGKIPMSEEQIRQRIQKITGEREPYEIASWSKSERNDVIRRLKEEGLSIRQIERATGISRGIVAKC
jgi:putative transposase